MTRRTRIISFISAMLFLFAIQNSNAQHHQLPIVGPLVAVTPATHQEIHLYDVATGETRVLSFGNRQHHVWGFSPDGCRVMFTLDDWGAGFPLLYTANLDGTDLQAMVRYDERPAGTWGVWDAVWSSQNRIAFTLIEQTSTPSGENRLIHRIATVNGTTPNAPTFYTERANPSMSPQWSPDGIWLAYVRYQDRVPGTDLLSTAVPTNPPPPDVTPVPPPLISEADLWVVSADGQDHYPLTDFPVGSIRSPRWSPDGLLIAFIYSPTPSSDLFYMIGNQAGALATQLNFEWQAIYDLIWKPDGSSLVSTMRGFRDITRWGLWSIPLIGNADEGATLFLPETDTQPSPFDLIASPQFSPDGRYLAFRHAYQLVIYQIAQNTWVTLDQASAGHSLPVWTPANFSGESACH